MTQDAIHRDSFILRIWREGENLEWKGWVQYVNSGESIPLCTLTDLLTFIERHTGELVPPTQEKQIQSDCKRKSGLK